MNLEALINRAGKLERKKALADLLEAVEGLSTNQAAALISRIMREVVAGKISAAEANAISRAVKI